MVTAGGNLEAGSVKIAVLEQFKIVILNHFSDLLISI